ncbi:MAG: DUF3387 domain-containing protein [Alphaproteobacteria bacterium]|nr:DUF3387 domain-containing protein [Alphaproteobacteria bacterium]
MPIASARSVIEAIPPTPLRVMARELAETVRQIPKLDWTQRESVRAGCAGIGLCRPLATHECLV